MNRSAQKTIHSAAIISAAISGVFLIGGISSAATGAEIPVSRQNPGALQRPGALTPAPQGGPAAPAQGDDLQVSYNQETGVITLEAHEVPLDKILWEISKAGGVDIRLPRGGEDPLKPVSISARQLPLDTVMKKLFRGVNAIYTYKSTQGPNAQTGQSRLTGVIVLSIPPRLIETGSSRVSSLSSLNIENAKRSFRDDRDISSLLVTNPAEAGKTVKSLKASGSEKDIANAAETLVDTLRDKQNSGRLNAVKALEELAPESAVEPFIEILADEKEHTRLRLLVVNSLIRIGGKKGVQPLITAFQGNEPRLQQASAAGLAQIGGEEGLKFLISVAKNSSSPSQKLSAIVSLAFLGGPAAKQELKKAIEEGQILPSEIPKDVSDEL